MILKSFICLFYEVHGSKISKLWVGEAPRATRHLNVEAIFLHLGEADCHE